MSRLDMALDDLAKKERSERPKKQQGGRPRGGRDNRDSRGGDRTDRPRNNNGGRSMGGGRGGPERRRGGQRGRRNPYSRVRIEIKSKR